MQPLTACKCPVAPQLVHSHRMNSRGHIHVTITPRPRMQPGVTGVPGQRGLARCKLCGGSCQVQCMVCVVEGRVPYIDDPADDEPARRKAARQRQRAAKGKRLEDAGGTGADQAGR